MATIIPPIKFPLPKHIGKIIAEKNPNSVYTDLGIDGWLVEGPTLLVFESWFRDVLPDPWGSGLYITLYKFASGLYNKIYKHMFIVSDYQPAEITIPVPFDVVIAVDELSNRFGLNQVEVILGILTQVTSSLTRTSLDKGIQEDK